MLLLHFGTAIARAIIRRTKAHALGIGRAILIVAGGANPGAEDCGKAQGYKCASHACTTTVIPERPSFSAAAKSSACARLTACNVTRLLPSNATTS
jgi:hypothetical protein